MTNNEAIGYLLALITGSSIPILIYLIRKGISDWIAWRHLERFEAGTMHILYPKIDLTKNSER